MRAPTGRIASVAVMVKATSAMERWKSRATVGITKTSTKKSKASRVQPRKLATRVWTAAEVDNSCGAGAPVDVISAAIGGNVIVDAVVRGNSARRFHQVARDPDSRAAEAGNQINGRPAGR